MDFRLLGPLQVEQDGVRIDLGRRRERCLIGLLLLEPGKVLPAQRLLDLLWDDAPPETGLGQLRSNISRLRTRLKAHDSSQSDVRIRTHGSGYSIDVAPDRIDVHRFQRLLANSTNESDPGVRAKALRAALGLWRGPLLADVMSDRLRRRVAGGLEEQHLNALERLGEAELQAGHAQAVVTELTELTTRHPLRERLSALLMIAHVRTGSPGEASRVFHRLRTQLAEQLGLNPSPELRHLHDQVLTQDPALLDAATRAHLRAATPVVAPAQLPADLLYFTGRTRALHQLDTLLTTAGQATGATATLICTISGTAGVGKTTLAVHWAHTVRRQFPDGQLYLNLRGFDPIAAPLAPREALRHVFDSLDVPGQRVPTELDAQTALYRSLLADKRMLVLLDNARDAEQVRPLLPTCSSWPRSVSLGGGYRVVGELAGPGA
jgi:DNA-binding SARP family transcriptional activator